MSYLPSGFFSRLITRILADEKMVEAIRHLYLISVETCGVHYESFQASARWSVWQTGLALYYGDNLVFYVKEISEDCSASPYRNIDNRFQIQQEGVWSEVDLIKPSILELHFPFNVIKFSNSSDLEPDQFITIYPDHQLMTQLLAISVDHIDLLLEDFYPAIGTHFNHFFKN